MIGLSSRLALSRLTANRSGLDALAVLAFAVTSWLSLTVAGGTWMFVERAAHPPEEFAAFVAPTTPFSSPNDVARYYVFLAIIACSVLIIPILTLGGAAARLGASGRARRLAALRLLGMTGAEVVLMSAIESVVLSVLGVLVGALLFAVTLPAWSLVTFQLVPIDPSEMVMPLWLAFLVAGVIVILAALSTLVGLRRVRISPLGVARRTTTPKLAGWRVVALVIAVGLFLLATQDFDFLNSDLMGILIPALFIALLLLAISVVGPFVIQLGSMPLARTSNPATLIAARRLTSSPKAAWRNVAAIAVVALIATWSTILTASTLSADDVAGSLSVRDVHTGTLITLAIGFVLAGSSTLINQASLAVDQGEQLIALARIGTPRRVFGRARMIQVAYPIILTFALAMPVGALMSYPFTTSSAEPLTLTFEPFADLAIIIAAGVALTLLAAWACRPIETKILTADYRPND